MGQATYEIIGAAGEWRVRHDGEAVNVYETKEAAFEAAVAAASLALHKGMRSGCLRQAPKRQRGRQT
jgi:hypothetical protein